MEHILNKEEILYLSKEFCKCLEDNNSLFLPIEDIEKFGNYECFLEHCDEPEFLRDLSYVKGQDNTLVSAGVIDSSEKMHLNIPDEFSVNRERFEKELKLSATKNELKFAEKNKKFIEQTIKDQQFKLKESGKEIMKLNQKMKELEWDLGVKDNKQVNI